MLNVEVSVPELDDSKHPHAREREHEQTNDDVHGAKHEDGIVVVLRDLDSHELPRLQIKRKLRERTDI